MNKNISNQIIHITNRLKFYTNLFFASFNPWEKMYYINLISNELFWLNSLIQQLDEYIEEKETNLAKRQFTLTELANFNGANEKPAYVAVNGVVYDVGLEKTWGGGTHFGLIAGRDLTSQFKNCHNAQTILNSLPEVGVLI